MRLFSLDRLVVRTSRCGRDNPGSNPGLDIYALLVAWLGATLGRVREYRMDETAFGKHHKRVGIRGNGLSPA